MRTIPIVVGTTHKMNRLVGWCLSEVGNKKAYIVMRKENALGIPIAFVRLGKKETKHFSFWSIATEHGVYVEQVEGAGTVIGVLYGR